MMHKYVIEYNDDAIQRWEADGKVKVEEVELDNRDDLVEVLNDLFVDCTIDTESDDDKYRTFDSWLNTYEEDADYSGSAVVLSITEDGKEIYRNSEYDYFLDDDYEDELED